MSECFLAIIAIVVPQDVNAQHRFNLMIVSNSYGRELAKVVHEVCSEWHGSTLDQFSYTEVKGALQSAKLILTGSFTLYSLHLLPSTALRLASRLATKRQVHSHEGSSAGLPF